MSSNILLEMKPKKRLYLKAFFECNSPKEPKRFQRFNGEISADAIKTC